ncbi:MAG TPA: gamma-glutamylcyclotransferase family protein [Gammaproteobacteria bacterium]|nr:gamma-glutamylcyclotransferase family protein [Gammaproteobacteria bacterium]
MTVSYSEHLFSYGTLQQESVQLANFARKLKGLPDVVTGWRLSTVEIKDPAVLAQSGLAVHRILVPGRPSDEVDGVVFEITPKELEAADAYETDAYQRIRVTLRSGTEVWVYVAS